MKYVGIIPARYQSSRFPGKPLAMLKGRPMIWWVYQSASKFKGFHDLVVATDSDKIAKVCKQYDIHYVLTSPDHPDCIDRAAEVAANYPPSSGIDRFIVIQGDEPLFDASILDADYSPSVVNFYTKVSDPSELDDPNAVKVVVSKSLKAIYFSRYSIPYHSSKTRKSDDPINIDKQIGVYAFSGEALRQFTALGMSYLEGIEGIGLLRFFGKRY